MKDSFGQYLARRRKAAGLRQSELARRLSVTTAYVRDIERGVDPTGKRGSLRPAREIVDAIAEALKIPQAEVRRAAGYSVPAGAAEKVRPGEKVSPERNGFGKSDFAALYRKYDGLTPEQKSEFKPILLMIDRELDRMRQAAGK